MFKIKKIGYLLLASTILVGASVVYANHNKFAIGANLGTQGIGIEGRMKLGQTDYGSFIGRLGGNYFQYNKSGSEAGFVDLGEDLFGRSVSSSISAKYKIGLKLTTIPFLIDYHPFDNGFRISLGAAYNGNKIKASVNPKGAILINGNTYNELEVGTIKGQLTLGNKVVPIAAIGYDSSLMNDSAFSFNTEIGLIYAGSPKVKVKLTGELQNEQKLIDDVVSNANKNLKKIKVLKYYPVLSFGVKYSF